MGSCLSGRSRKERDLVHSSSDEPEEKKISVQCVDDPEPLKPVVYYDDDETFRMMHQSPVDAGGDDKTSELAVLNKLKT